MGRRRKSRSIKAKGAERLRDPGPDEGGRYSPSPWALQHGHMVETAPRDLRATPDSSFPKRIATQRIIDRYRAHGHLEHREWQAANALWSLWCHAGLEAKVTSGYEPVTIGGTSNQDHKIAKRLDGAMAFLEAMRAVPYRSQGAVRAVVVQDWTASQWARGRGYTGRDSERLGLTRLRSGLQALAAHLGY